MRSSDPTVYKMTDKGPVMVLELMRMSFGAREYRMQDDFLEVFRIDGISKTRISELRAQLP